MVRVRVLGQLAADVGGVPADLGGRQQRAVLARLLVARGSVVSTDRLIDDLWRGEPPPRAIASLQAYVSNLRRAVEPARPPRSPARLLVTAPPGYAFRADDDVVDAWQFETLVRTGRSAATVRPEDARDRLDGALRLWQGRAYAEFADEPWAAAEAVRLDEVRRIAAETLVAVTLRCGEPAQAVPLAEALVHEHPLREESWRLLAVALWSGNRSADALNALRRARTVFAAELGIDVAPALAGLERDILAQRTDGLDLDRIDAALPSPAAPAHPPAHPPAHGEVFVGRGAELAVLVESAGDALGGRPRLVLLDGESGIGKSSLLTHLAVRLASQGWLVARGRCPEDEGTPAAYAWTEVLRGLAPQVPAEPPPVELLSGETAAPRATDAAEARFRSYRAAAAWLRRVAGARPLAILLDDLHNADSGTLALLTHIAHDAVEARMLLVAAFRPTDAGGPFRDALAGLATRSPARLSLAGLPGSDVDRLVARLHDAPIDPTTVRTIAERTGGNPFYVRETVRLLASEGALVAVSEVPAGVRDVIRRRLARLPEPTVSVLCLAAVVGLEFDVDVIVDTADVDHGGVLDALEAGVIAGLLREPAPGRMAFAHALVRDTIYSDLTHLRRSRLHARVAADLARTGPHDDAALAHHFARAASAETAALAVHHAVRAAERAERGHAHDNAVALLEQAIECHEMIRAGAGVGSGAGAGAADRDADRVALLGRLLRSQVRAGAVADARATRDRAVEIAELAGREDLLIAAFAAWTEPTPWIARPYGVVDRRAVDGLARLLHRTDLGPRTRCSLLATYVTELAGDGDPSAARAASEAVEIARRHDDPALLALALFERARNLSWDRDHGPRAELADEIDRIAAEHHLVAYRWRALHVAATVAAARGDLATLRARVDRGLEMARQYQMAEPYAVGLSARAMLAHIAGRFDEAERTYAEVRTMLARSRSPHAAGFGDLASVTVRASQGRIAELAPAAGMLIDAYGPAAVDVAAAALAAAGDHAAAAALLADPPPLRPDFYFSIFATLRANAVTALRRRDLAEELYAALLPVRAQLAGAASTSLAMRPVAHTLAELAGVLGRTATVEEHLAEAVAVAERWQAPVWRADASRAHARFGARLRAR
jgi:DNA-binding SARP family transcriptional activator